MACCRHRAVRLRAIGSTKRQRSNASGSTRALQHLGFTLDEAIDALRSHDAGTATCESELWRMQAVIDRIDTKIAELQATRRDVSETMDACQQGHCRFG